MFECVCEREIIRNQNGVPKGVGRSKIVARGTVWSSSACVSSIPRGNIRGIHPFYELQKKKEFIGLCYAWGIFAERGPNTDYSYLIAL